MLLKFETRSLRIFAFHLSLRIFFVFVFFLGVQSTNAARFFIISIPAVMLMTLYLKLGERKKFAKSRPLSFETK